MKSENSEDLKRKVTVMKKILALLLAVLTLFAFTACSGNASIPDGYKIASNADVCDYTLFVPETDIDPM